jgi:PAS domain S-box-containing protein
MGQAKSEQMPEPEGETGTTANPGGSELGIADRLRAEIEELRIRLSEAEETIRAIREGEVDAFVVAGEEVGAERVFTLETAEHPYRRLVEVMHQAAMTVAADGTIVYANRAFSRTMLRPGQSVLGRPVLDLVAEVSRPTVAGVLAHPAGGRHDVQLVRGDGTTIPVRMTASSPDEEGIICLVVTDLTDQRRLEEVVAAETLSRSILDQIVDAVVVGDPGGTLIRAGAAARRLCGCDPVGLSFDEAFPLHRRGDDSHPRFGLPLTRVISGQTIRGLEVRLDAPDGRTSFDLLLSAGPLRDPEGLVVGFVATLTDVTERLRAERALRARERELQMVADNTPDLLVRFNRELRHSYINATIERITGRPRSDFLGKTNQEIGIPDDLCNTWDIALRSVFETRESQSIEFDYPTPGGIRHFSSLLVPEPGPDGEVRSILGVTHDVTDRRLYEQTLRDQDRRKDEFLATLAHELRNPLAAIGNASHIARQTPSDEASRAWAHDVIARQVRQLVHLVDDLLDVSRINLGKIELRREIFDVRGVIGRAIETVQPQILTKRQSLEFAQPKEALFVEADPTRIEQVLVNLLSNASKYTDEVGRIAVDVRAEGSELIVRIEDSGIGLAQEDLQRIFEPFGQVEKSLARSHGGLGIGLTLVRRLMELHGGKVEVASEGLGHGSVFTVRLPLTRVSARTDQVPDRDPANREAETRRILVVDDNVDGASGLARLLRCQGFEVETVYNGPAALDAVAASPPSVALLDIGLPGMDGYQLAGHLRERYGPRITLYALSGYGREEDRRRADEAGFDQYLIKPVNLELLLKLLANETAGTIPSLS